jgi:hypothetical protein
MHPLRAVWLMADKHDVLDFYDQAANRLFNIWGLDNSDLDKDETIDRLVTAAYAEPVPGATKVSG